MKDPCGRQPTRVGRDRAAGGATTLSLSDRVQFFHQGGAPGAVDRAVNASSSSQPAVCGVADGVGLDVGDVALKEAKLAARELKGGGGLVYGGSCVPGVLALFLPHNSGSSHENGLEF